MGHRTRTHPRRLALLDAILLTLEPTLLCRGDGLWARAPIVDLGIGSHPWTTLELADRVSPLPVIGVDHSMRLIRQARPLAPPNVSFTCASFDLPVRNVRLIRVMNVLRDGPPEAVSRAHTVLGRSLLDGGLLIEGSCAPRGEVGTAHWLRKSVHGLVREGLVLWLSGDRGMHPMAFLERLPRDLVDNRAHPIFTVLHQWTASFERLPSSTERIRQAAKGVQGLHPIPVPHGEAFKLDWAVQSSARHTTG